MPRVERWKIWCDVIVVLAFLTLGNFHSALAGTGSHAAVGDMSTSKFAQFIRDYAEAHHFNGSIRVEIDGKLLFSGSFGIADRAFNVPCTEDTRYKIASITKAFTAVLVLQLIEEQNIDLDQPIKHYLSSYYGEGADSVKIRMLLNHTSALPNTDAAYNSVTYALATGMPHYQPATPEQLTERYYSGKLHSPPGKVFSYNNADYIVLGRIIESVTGKTFEQVLADRNSGASWHARYCLAPPK